MLRPIQYFWNNAELVCHASEYVGDPFRAHRGVIQGVPLSLQVLQTQWSMQL